VSPAFRKDGVRKPAVLNSQGGESKSDHRSGAPAKFVRSDQNPKISFSPAVATGRLPGFLGGAHLGFRFAKMLGDRAFLFEECPIAGGAWGIPAIISVLSPNA
jgi:hypothetical protein